MKRSAAIARTGVVASVAALLSAALQRTSPGLVPTLVALSLLAVAGAAIWLVPGSPTGHIVALALCAPVLLIAVGDDAPASSSPQGLAAAAGPLVLALAGVSLMRRRLAITLVVLGGLIAGPIRVLVYDPFLDPGCHACGHAPVALWPHPRLAVAMQVAGIWLALVATTYELIRGRRAMAGIVVCLAALAIGAPRQPTLVLGGVYVAVVWARRCWIRWRRHSVLRRLLVVHEHEGGLTDILRRAMRDPTLVVAFPTTDGMDFVDARGEPLAATDEETSTDLFVDGELLARVHHSSRSDFPDLDAALDPTAGLILQKERLTAQLAARVHELTRARTHVVRVGLDQRRSLERDLHDGVQQQLLALGLDIRLALGTLPNDSPDLAPLEEALVLVHGCVDRVRAISTGVSPPMLATRGLRAALTALVRRNGTPVEVGDLPEGRLPTDVERAAYAVASEALARGATSLRATEADGKVTVVAEGTVDGADGVLPDLIAALGGRISLGGSSIEAVIPCAS
jgi:signal transduction histidine kinase